MITFPAFAFRQIAKSPITAAFVTSSASIDEWAKVPTRLSNRPHQFQRAAMPAHVEEIKRFFAEDSSRQNSSPTAILIGVEPNSVPKIGLTKEDGTLLSDTDITPLGIRCTVAIDFSPWDSSPFDGNMDAEIDALFERVKGLYTFSDSSGEDENEQQAEDDEDSEDVEANAHTDELDSDEDESEEKTETDVEGVADTTADTTAFLWSIPPAELRQSCESKAYVTWPAERKAALIELFKDELKPCLIIDGQHRIKGTKDIGEIPFLVALLPNADWAELAFQFIVNNSSAKKVDENLLFGIVGHSLTPSQLQATEARLNRSGIKVSLIRAAMRVQLELNPFVGMLRTNTPGERGFIDASAMQKKVIELWYGSRGRNGLRPTFKVFRALTESRKRWSMGELFQSVCTGNNAVERAQDWQDNHWFRYFKAFWEAISEHFHERLWPSTQEQWLPPEGVPRSMSPEQRERQKLMRATVLGLLQRALLQAWADYESRTLEFNNKTFADLNLKPAKFKKQIAKWVARMPSDFFTELKYTGFDASKELREEMTQQMLYVIEAAKTFANIRSTHRFWN